MEATGFFRGGADVGIACSAKTDRWQDGKSNRERASQNSTRRVFDKISLGMAAVANSIGDDFQWPIVAPEGISITAWTVASVK